jgi:signal transduction histidine kinase
LADDQPQPRAFSRSGAVQAPELAEKRFAGITGWWARWVVVPVIWAGCGLAFFTDITNDQMLAFGLFYVPLVCTAVFLRDRRAAWWLALVASAMVVVGIFLPEVNEDLVTLLGNRVLSIAVIFLTAVLVRYMRVIQDRLAEQTARVEQADRIKTEIFTMLSQELRTPLHAIIGFSELMLADCRPDQRLPLGQVQSGGKRLLITIDNLIDLTNVEERVVRAEQVLVSAVLHAAIDAARFYAAERSVALLPAFPEQLPAVCADEWALRRILDNLLDNAIKFSGQHGVVEISAESAPDAVIVCIRDNGIGMAPHMVQQLGEPFFRAGGGAHQFEGTGTGLALSRRLAAAMEARVEFDSAPGDGTTVSLRLRRWVGA